MTNQRPDTFVAAMSGPSPKFVSNAAPDDTINGQACLPCSEPVCMFAEMQDHGGEQRHSFPRVQAQPGIQLDELLEPGQGHTAGTVPTPGNGIEEPAFRCHKRRCRPEPRSSRNLSRSRITTSDAHQRLVGPDGEIAKPPFVHDQFAGLSKMNAPREHSRIGEGSASPGGQSFNCGHFGCFPGIRERNDGVQGNKQEGEGGRNKLRHRAHSANSALKSTRSVRQFKSGQELAVQRRLVLAPQ